MLIQKKEEHLASTTKLGMFFTEFLKQIMFLLHQRVHKKTLITTLWFILSKLDQFGLATPLKRKSTSLQWLRSRRKDKFLFKLAKSSRAVEHLRNKCSEDFGWRLQVGPVMDWIATPLWIKLYIDRRQPIMDWIATPIWIMLYIDGRQPVMSQTLDRSVNFLGNNFTP